MTGDNKHQQDRERAQRAFAGDEAAWRAIYDSTCDRLFAFLCYQMRDRDEARDILQETYLQAFRHMDRYRGDAPLEVWKLSAIDWATGPAAVLAVTKVMPQ